MDEHPVGESAPASLAEERPEHWADAVRLTPDEVVRRRLLVEVILRIIALLCAVLWILPILSWLHEGLRDDDLFYFSYYSVRLMSAAMLLLVAGMGFFLAPRIARRLVPIDARALCPACGFDLVGLAKPQCPECGLLIARSDASRSVPIQFQTWMLGTVVVLRILAVGLVAQQISVRLSSLYWYEAGDYLYFIFFPLMGRQEFFQSVMVFVTCLGPGLLLWWLAPFLARRAVRMRH